MGKECRQHIIEDGLRPWPKVANWDGYYAITPMGVKIWMAAGMRAEMRKLIAEGYFSQIKPVEPKIPLDTHPANI